jgi:hypothetical protein
MKGGCVSISLTERFRHLILEDANLLLQIGFSDLGLLPDLLNLLLKDIDLEPIL